MSIPRKIAYNVIISSVAKILSTIAALVGIGFITRYLGTDGFGNYTTALAFLSLFAALGDWGLNQTCTREISCPDADEKKIISNVAGLRLVISFAVLLLAPIITYFLPYPKELKLGIILVTFSFIFSSAYQVLNGLFQKRLTMNQVTLAELTGKIIQVVLIITGIKLDLGFYFIISTLLVSMGINFLLVVYLSRRFIKFYPSFDFEYWKKFLKQSAPLGIGAIVSFMYFKADSILLSILKTPADVGLYGAAYKVVENVSFFPAMIVGLTMPLFTFHLSSNREKFEKMVNKNFKVFLILVLPIIIGAQFLADGIIGIIAGSGYEVSANILRILVFALAFIFFGTLFNNVLVAARLQKSLLWILVAGAVFNITSNLIFIPKFSYFAPAVTSVSTEFLVAALSFWVIWRKIKFTPKSDKVLLMLVSGLLMAGYLWLLGDSNFFLRLLTSPLVYFGSLILFNVISKEEILSLISKKPQVE